MPLPDAVLEKLKTLGIRDPENLSASDVDRICRAAIETKAMNLQEFVAVVEFAGVATKPFMEGAWKVASHGKDITEKALGIINQAVLIIGEQLKRDLPGEERAQLLRLVEKLIEAAQAESKRGRDSGTQVIAIVGAVLMAVVGLVSFFAGSSRRK